MTLDHLDGNGNRQGPPEGLEAEGSDDSDHSDGMEVDIDMSDEEDYHSDVTPSPGASSSSSSSDTSVQDAALVVGLKSKEKQTTKEQLTERTYQTVLIGMAIEQNSIICLPTGSGKTFIGVQLIRHFLNFNTKPDQIIVFLACSVPLVNQQAKYIRDHICPSFDKGDELVMELTGDKNIDKYSKDSNQRPIWESWMQKHKIFVMTAQIFLDCLSSANIQWKNVSLAIFDECHNAVGDHCMVGVREPLHNQSNQRLVPMNSEFDNFDGSAYSFTLLQIMKHYEERKIGGYQPLPRILGLTATIINGGKAKQEEINEHIRRIERLFDARALTYHSYEDVLKHSTNAMITYAYYKQDPGTYLWNVDNLTAELRDTEEFLTSLDKNQFDNRGEKIKDIEHESLKHRGQVFGSNAKNIPQELQSVIRDVTNVLRDLGPYCARMACQLKRSFLVVEMEMADNDVVKHLCELVDTTLFSFLHDLNELMGDATEEKQITGFISDKLLSLCLRLEATQETFQEPLCGLVFGQQRLTVQVLAWYFQDRARVWPRSSFIKPFFVVGNSGTGTDSEEARVTAAKQAKVIEKFHKKEYNLLFATKVLEEGINVPICNMVVRFDPVQAYPSYVQSMGRARQRNAAFHVFVEASEAKTMVNKLQNYTHFNKMLANYLRENARHADEVDEDENDERKKLLADRVLKPYRPEGLPDSAEITATEAISRVHMYCATLSCDRLVVLAPVSWWERSENLYRAFVLLPANSAYREVIVGKAMESKYLAKRAAFLKTCKILYKRGGLDRQLRPTPRAIPPLIIDCLDKIEAESKNDGRAGKAGTNKKTKWYPKKVSDPSNIIRPNMPCNIYAILIEQVQIVDKYRDEAKLYNFEHRKYLFAIVTSKDLSKVKGFRMYAKCGTFFVRLKRIALSGRSSQFTADEISQLTEFQQSAFVHLGRMDLSSRFFQKVDTPYLITPLKKINPFAHGHGQAYEIDWGFVNVMKITNNTGAVIRKPSEAERQSMTIDARNYDDSIVVPWHGNPDPKAKYCVIEVLGKQTPYSPFEENPGKYSTYTAYYKEKHGVTPCQSSQPLLKCKQIGKQLNFLNHKTDKTGLQDKNEKEQAGAVPRLIPEFCNLSPIPASYYLQAKFLPSVIHRVGRLLLAREIKESVANYFQWKKALEDEDEPERMFMESSKVPATAAHSTSRQSGQNVVEALASKMSNFVLEPRGKNQPSATVVRSASKIACNNNLQIRNPSDSLLDVDAFHYEYEHPMKMKLESVKKSAKEKRQRKSKKIGSTFEGHTPPPSKSSLTGISLMKPEEIPSNLTSLDKRTDFLTESGPPTHAIMEALTLSKAEDSFSLERLEVIGDSVLKLLVTQFIYGTYPDWQEGQMTSLRNRLVSNAHLYYFAKMNNFANLGEILSGSIFKPNSDKFKCNWLPPGFTSNSRVAKIASMLGCNTDIFDPLSIKEINAMDEEALFEWAKKHAPKTKISLRTCYTHSQFGDKSVADSVEALVGAWYMHGGLDSAARFMEWIGLSGPGPNGEKILYGRPTPVKLNYPSDIQIQLLPSLLSNMEKLFSYKFKNPWLVIEAFTHPGFKGNRVTGGYQRLEFLGDAILDFLVTNHIYPTVATPGKLTDLKSALVNNVTFGSLCIRYDLHTYLLHNAKVLEQSIDSFVQYQNEHGHQVTGHFNLLNDMECLLATDVEVPKILGDLWESLAGAIYIDSGMSLDTVWRVFYRLMKNEIDTFSKEIPLSPIRELYELFPGQIKFCDPSEKVAEKVTNEMGWTIMRVEVPTIGRVYGCGSNKKNAKAAAAKCALKMVKMLKSGSRSK